MLGSKYRVLQNVVQSVLGQILYSKIRKNPMTKKNKKIKIKNMFYIDEFLIGNLYLGISDPLGA